MDNVIDCTIIGGGISALTAALYLARVNKSVAVIYENLGGNLSEAINVENYPGIDSINGIDLINNIKDSIEKRFSNLVSFHQFRVEAEMLHNDEKNKIFIVNDPCNRDYPIKSHKLILATGTSHRELDEDVINSKIHYCAMCDGIFYSGKDVAVIGGGNSALNNAEFLKSIGCNVTIIHRHDYKADQSRIDAVRNCDDIKAHIVRIIDNLIKLQFDDGNVEFKYFDGYFISIGHYINYELAKYLGVDFIDDNRTNVKGLFLCGSNSTTNDQAIIAAGDGASCAIEVIKDLSYDSIPDVSKDIEELNLD